MSNDKRSTIRLSQYGYQAQVAPSMTRPGSVAVGFYNAAGDATVNPGCFTADEWDAFVAAGNRALGRDVETPAVRADVEALRDALTRALDGWEQAHYPAPPRRTDAETIANLRAAFVAPKPDAASVTAVRGEQE